MIRYLKYTLIIAVVAWVAGFFVYLHLMPRDVGNQYSNTDAIIVLTGGSGRIRTGVSLLYQKKSDKLFISGVDSGTDVDMIVAAIDDHSANKNEKNHFRNYLTNRVMMRRRIYLGYEAQDTMENALETAEWVYRENVKSIRLVTSAYHMPRAMLYFKNIPELIWANNKDKYKKQLISDSVGKTGGVSVANYAKGQGTSAPESKKIETLGLVYGKLGTVEIIQHPVFNQSINYDEWWSSFNTLRIFVTEYNKYMLSIIYQMVALAFQF
ncbi:MAG: YdcF family protein [Alphaproteobacteria bacterium]|nr:YdcF family protein [Alphaproteobacteria bacterium]